MRRRLSASSPAADTPAKAAPGGALVPLEAEALYLLAKAHDVLARNPALHEETRQRLAEDEAALRAVLKSQFAKAVARALVGARDVPAAAREHATALKESARKATRPEPS